MEESPIEETWKESPDESSLTQADDMIEYVDTIEGIEEFDTEEELVIEENPDKVPQDKTGDIDDILNEGDTLKKISLLTKPLS